jgi:hypothetical protein
MSSARKLTSRIGNLEVAALVADLVNPGLAVRAVGQRT